MRQRSDHEEHQQHGEQLGRPADSCYRSVTMTSGDALDERESGASTTALPMPARMLLIKSIKLPTEQVQTCHG